LGVGAATECEYGRFAQFERAAECGAKLRGFEQAERGLAVAFEKFCDAQAGSVFDAVIEINESPGKLARELRADGSLSGAHESGEGDNGDGRSASHAEGLDECATRRKECGMFALSEALKFVSFGPAASALTMTVLR